MRQPPGVHASEGPDYQFTPKFQWHVKLHLMSGVTLGPWLRLLWVHKNDIHWRLYWHRVAFLTFMAVLNTILAIPDWFRFNRRVASQQLHSEPLFILGNPRTGTTHLHNLLSLDPEFVYANTFQAGFPSSFITLEQLGARPLLQPVLSPTRPMDAMKLTWDTPAEDEIAVQTLTGGVSYYHPLVFPSCEKSIRGLLTMKRASLEQYTAWQDALLWFLKKVTFRDCWLRGRQGGKGDVPPKPLLIKSPVHTARLGTWRHMFPNARYIYIHRNPYEVFRSSCHMVDTYFWYCFLQMPTNKELTDYILDQYVIMYEDYIKERVHVKDRLVEVRFEDLDRNPMQVIEHIYKSFGWEDRFIALKPKFESYLSSIEDFKKNQFNKLDTKLQERVGKVWGPSFDTFGYKK